MTDLTYQKEFQYSHKNPYHEKLEEFSEFLFRDAEAEKFQGKWNNLVFKREAPLLIEIGSGYGHFMVDYCEKNPDINFVGMDFRFKRSFNLAKRLSKLESPTFRYLRAKGERIEFLFGENEVDEIFYFFPDPWRKKRHHKKRLFQEPFLKAAHKVLKPGGKLWIKTDHDGYAEWMEERIDQTDLFDCELKTWNLHKTNPDHFLAEYRTKFEKIFLKKDVPIKAFVLRNLKES